MRIVELINTLEIGGAERMMVDLACSLHRRGHTVTAVCLRHTGALASLLDKQGIEIVELHKGSGFQLSAVKALARILRERSIDVVHTHNPIVHHYGALAGRLAGVHAIVNTLHGPGNLQGFGTAEIIFDLSCLLTTKVVGCCHAVEKHLAKMTHVGRRISTTVGNGIELDRFLSIPPRNPGSSFVFGAVGRLATVKDYPSLLAAFATARKSLPHARLEILGDGPLRAELEQQARSLALGDAVVFRGASLDVGEFLRAVDVFVIASRSEGLPLTVLEAMAAARPVLGTSVGAIPELVESSGCGWITPPGDPAQMAATMQTIVRDTNLPERGLRGRDYVRQHHSVESMTTGYEQLFKQSLAAAGQRRVWTKVSAER